MPGKGRSKVLMALAFGAIYLIWGSTFLAIRYAVETFPPFLMMACRSLGAGAVLYAWARLRERARPRLIDWRNTAVTGTLLFVGGHGALAWGEQHVASGVAALILATIPIWMAVLHAVFSGPSALSGRIVLGLVLGFFGVVLLIEPVDVLQGASVDRLGALILLLGALSWATGSLFSRAAKLPRSSILTAGMSLLAGGTVLLAASRLSGEEVDAAALSARSLLALAYLIVFGSIVGLAAYVWLLRVTSPARVSTYAFVNPVVAVLLGWAIGGELLTARILIAGLLMVTGVGAIVTGTNARAGPATDYQNKEGS